MNRERALKSIVRTAGDYRAGEIPRFDVGHVERWVGQFEPDVQTPVLVELAHVLDKSYVTRSKFEAFVDSAVLAGVDEAVDAPVSWLSSRFFRGQLRGRSQGVMLDFFDQALGRQYGFDTSTCEGDGTLVYVDDAVYTGMHVLNDLTPWIPEAPETTDLCIFAVAVHSQGRAYATQQLSRRFAAAGKRLKVRWRTLLELENSTATDSDVLWPKTLPEQPEARQYVQALTHAVVYRRGDGLGQNQFFSSALGRELLEQEFLKLGAKLRADNPHLKHYARPLGNMVLESLGFGALVVTYRNCANNCPLVFWAGAAPLFPRSNN